MITVYGLWHLGSVTAACCAKYFPTVGLDCDVDLVSQLQNGKAPLFEPGLDDLIKEGLNNNKLKFTSNPKKALVNTKLLWITFDTPVDDDDNANCEFVINKIHDILNYTKPGTTVLISSQLPVGSIKRIEDNCKTSNINFASYPENLRLGKSIDIFTNPDRIIAGVRSEKVKKIISPILEKFSSNIEWMSVESAEMTKHAINTFLAMSISYANELANLCESVGADAFEVAKGLKTESRIGHGAYVDPGKAFAGGTLARDIQYLSKLGKKFNKKLHVISNIKKSNDSHKLWPYHRLKELIGPLSDMDIGILGLTYKVGTNTLRRSSSLDLARMVIKDGGKVKAYDPHVDRTNKIIDEIDFVSSAEDVIQNIDALLILTEWPEFKELNWDRLILLIRKKIIIDPNRFCYNTMPLSINGLQYISVGVS